MQNTLVDDINPVTSMLKLRYLYLQGTPVTDFSPLFDMPLLETSLPDGRFYLKGLVGRVLGNIRTDFQTFCISVLALVVASRAIRETCVALILLYFSPRVVRCDYSRRDVDEFLSMLMIGRK